MEALDKGDAERAVAAAHPLIGLGPGATPSGDDLLVGLAAGLAATDHPMARSFAAGVARQAAGMTTSVAESYLFHAGRLEFSERVHVGGAGGAHRPGARSWRAAVNAALAWGASSGADLMVGLLVGIEARRPHAGGATASLRQREERGRVSVVRQRVFRNAYRDSVELMRIAAEIERLPGVIRAGLVMCTPANLAIVRRGRPRARASTRPPDRTTWSWPLAANDEAAAEAAFERAATLHARAPPPRRPARASASCRPRSPRPSPSSPSRTWR